MRITLEELDLLEEIREENKQRGNKPIDPNTSIKIYDYHIQKTGLKKSELLLYEIIYGYTIGYEDKIFRGSANYLATRLNVNIPYVLKTLKKLTKEGYLKRIILNDHPCYRVTDTTIPEDMFGKYTIVDHRYIEAGLKGNKLLIYSYIDNLTNNTEEGCFWNTQRFIAKKFNMSVQSVCSCLKELEETGWIEKSEMYLISDTNNWADSPIYRTIR